ncbi:RING finger protein, putative [Pediculus humanus corporis]|uniref:RING-type E3 ubiquitin transferase n=1 Tax=Pediculus humanus subsp. corporis TaxID=121224 RepID=E0VDF8_PEDHC|nr:RING finger protein, putative [Pediculus humanus corporis]EEB11414.1 RING finger protein, putative [Pediculus humanus corporis]
MAEATVEDNTTNRFFCHKCSIEITRVLEDYTCPTCRGGFIEELDSTNTSDDPSDDHSDDEVEEFFSDVRNQLGQFLFERVAGRGNQNRDSRAGETEAVEGDGNGRRYQHGSSYYNINLRPSVLALIISLIISNRTRQNHLSFRNRVGRNQAIVINTLQYLEDFFSLPGMDRLRFFLGNPADYAWGREGLDTIVSQLLNHMDVSGPPPLNEEKIKEIPVTEIGQEQVDSKLQCSVCWEDFKIGESVRKLECEHFYHESCIVPWLELHGTCPICRKSLLSDEEAEKNSASTSNNSSTSNLAAMFQAVRRRSSNIHPGNSSSVASTSNTNNANGRQPSSSDFQMDLEYD